MVTPNPGAVFAERYNLQWIKLFAKALDSLLMGNHLSDISLSSDVRCASRTAATAN